MTAERDSDVTIRRRRFRVRIRPGTSGATPLVLLNGIGARLEVLQPLVDELSRDGDVVRVDMPGVGGSAAPRVPYSLATLSMTLMDVLGRLGYGAVDVLGFSWGGALAQHLAVQHPRRVRRLVLAATASGVLSVPASPQTLVRMATPRRHRDPVYAARIAPTLYGGTMRQAPTEAASLLHAASRHGARRAYYYQLLAASGWSSLPFLPLLRQPTLILAGDDDPLIPLANARLMARLIPHAQLHTYAGGHLALVTDAATLGPVIDRFRAAPD